MALVSTDRPTTFKVDQASEDFISEVHRDFGQVFEKIKFSRKDISEMLTRLGIVEERLNILQNKDMGSTLKITDLIVEGLQPNRGVGTNWERKLVSITKGNVTGAGTSGYVPVWGGMNSLSNSVIQASATAVKVGTGTMFINDVSDPYVGAGWNLYIAGDKSTLFGIRNKSTGQFRFTLQGLTDTQLDIYSHGVGSHWISLIPSVPSIVLDHGTHGSTTISFSGTNLAVDKPLQSTVVDGTAPFVVASTTLVTNLNAEHWNSKHLGSVTNMKLLRYNSTGTQLETGTVEESSGALSAITTLSMSGQLTNTLAIGTSPFAVTSTTVNTNLNADLLDGNHASAFAAASHNFLSATHGDTTAGSPVVGDLLVGVAGPAWSKLAMPAVGQLLFSTGAGTAAAWSASGGITGTLCVGNTTITGTGALFEVYSAAAAPILSLVGLHANAYDPRIDFYTDSPATKKWSLGCDSTDDSFRIELGAGALGAANTFVIDSGGRVGINSSVTTSAQLAVICAPTGAFSAVIGNITPTLSGNANFESRGFSGNLYTSYGGFTQSSALYGLDFTCVHNSAGTQAGNLMGIRVNYGSNLAGAVITGIASGLRIKSYAKAAITTFADIYIETGDTTTAPTTAWCLYSSHDAPSSLLGNLMVGGNTQTVVSHTAAELGIYDAASPCIAYAEAGFANPVDPGSISNGDKIIFYNDPNARVTRLKAAMGLSVGGQLFLERSYYGAWNNAAIEFWVGTPDVSAATAVARRAAYFQNDMSYVGEASVYLKEQAAAGGDLANYGQIWAKTDNTLWFTDEGGTDHQVAFV